MPAGVPEVPTPTIKSIKPEVKGGAEPLEVESSGERLPPQALPHLGHHKLIAEEPVRAVVEGKQSEPGPVYTGRTAARLGEEAMARIKAEGGIGDEPPESKLHYTSAELEQLAARSGFDPDRAVGGSKERGTLAASDDNEPRLAHGIKEYLMQQQPRSFNQMFNDYIEAMSGSQDGTYQGIPQPDRDRLEQQLEVELEGVIPDALRRAMVARSLQTHLDNIFTHFADPTTSRYGAEDPRAVARAGQLELMQIARMADEDLRITDPNLAGGVGFYVKRAFQRILGDRLLPPLESSWEWSAERVAETLQAEREERLETNTFWERIQSIYIELTGRSTPEIRRGAENWLHSIEQARYSSPQDVLQDIEYMRKQIVEKGARMHMSDDQINGLLSEIECRAYGRAAAYFMTRVPDGSIAGWAQLMHEFCRPERARERLKAGVRAYEGRVAYADDLLHWGTHHDGTAYSEYMRPETEVGRIRNKSRFVARQEQVKAKILSNMARKELKPKEQVWVERMNEALGHLQAAGMALPANFQINTLADESVFEELIEPIEDIVEAQGIAALQPGQRVLYRLGQWMTIRRDGDTLALIGRDQSFEERSNLFSEDRYNNQLVGIIAGGQFPEFIDTPQLQQLAQINNRNQIQEDLFRGLIQQRMEQIRLNGQLTAQQEGVFRELLREALVRRGGDSTRKAEWLSETERNNFEAQLRAVTGTPAQRQQAREAIQQQRNRLRTERQDEERLLGELLLVKYDHGQLVFRNLQVNLGQGNTVSIPVRSGDQLNLLRSAVPGFQRSEGALGVEENLLNVFLISSQLSPPTITMDNAPANAPAFDATGVRVGSELVPIEDIQRLLAWRRRTTDKTINLNGQNVPLRDIQYWQVRMLYLLVKLDQPLTDRGTYPDGELLSLYNRIISPAEVQEANEMLGGSDTSGLHLKRRARAVFLAEKIKRVIDAIEEDTRIVVQGDPAQGVQGLMQLGSTATFLEATTGQQRTFEDIRTDLDLDPQMNNYWGPGAQPTAQYFVSDENREAAHDPTHPYYNSAMARALRVLEQQYGPIPQIFTQDARLNHEITKRTEYERREYYALMSLAWRQGYDPQHPFESKINLGWYTMPYGGKRLAYVMPFMLMNDGNMRRGFEILPDLDFQVRGIAADHGRRGLNGYVGLIEGVGPRVTNKSGTGIDDTDTNRYIGRVEGADKGKLLFFAQAEQIGDRSRTGQLWKWFNDLAANFKTWDRKNIQGLLNQVVDTVGGSEEVMEKTEKALSRLWLTSAFWRFSQDREYGARMSRHAFLWWFYHSVDWGILGPGREDSSYKPFTPYLDLMLAPLPGESSDPDKSLINPPNAISLLVQRKIDGEV